ncbi:MAG: alpha-1,4-glucan--maltose-1-phosphate maltosyltransferase [Acidobacteria bacterium]|nr:alpha-1,4-glucan--maltose-1-phosphate maltosyltransferase [Acidobacteriota bacterium]
MKTRRARRPGAHRTSRPYEQVVIEAVWPSVDGGRHPVKGIVGDILPVEATVYRHGHERVRAALVWSAPGDGVRREAPMMLVNPGLDRWRGELRLEQVGRYRLAIAGWTDVYGSWVEELGKRVQTAQPDVASEIAEGIALVERVFKGLRGEARREMGMLLERLRDTSGEPARLLAAASSDEALALMARLAPRADEIRHAPELVVIADRERARAGAWYELFVRSQATQPGRSGTFRDAERRLPDIHAMGFDVVYLAPIHPVGRTGRKGPNNRFEAGPNDPGSPWAIGSEHGGHTAVEPALGTLEDFDRFVRAAEALGMDVALDFAIQCSPDHPWVHDHPEWFYRRPDGTIRYAENPPKKYEDIYPLNFDTPDWRTLWEALRDVVRFWVDRGVRIFRVDNPHTKPIGFWAWLIDSIQAEHPDVIFLAEAFTRPPMMQALAKRGFAQSYTYFTWRNAKSELVEYLTELTRTEMALYFRPNFFTNTPDILPPILQHGGPPAFKSRLVLAATLSPAYGIYSGFELCENAAIEGREEYLDSEKYEITVRDWNAPGNIKDLITRVNRARGEHSALQRFTNLRFLEIDDDQLIAYVKWAPDGSHAVIVVVNLDPFAAHEGALRVPPEAVGVAVGESYDVFDVLTGDRYTWGERNYVRLDPVAGEPAHIFRVERG